MTTQDHVQSTLTTATAVTTGLSLVTLLNEIEIIVRIGAGIGAIVVAIMTVTYYLKKNRLLDQGKDV